MGSECKEYDCVESGQDQKDVWKRDGNHPIQTGTSLLKKRHVHTNDFEVEINY